MAGSAALVQGRICEGGGEVAVLKRVGGEPVGAFLVVVADEGPDVGGEAAFLF